MSTPHETRPLYWSIRREVWENRSIYLAPLIVTVFVLLGSLVAASRLPAKARTPVADPVAQHVRMVMPFSMSPAPIMLTTFLVGLFYSIDALHGERRDRSLLFWKSLPVSDRTAVLAKATIPLVVLPLIAFLLSWATVLATMLFATLVMAANGVSPLAVWSEVRFIQQPTIMIYGLAAHALWFAPIHGWLLLVSAWARRSPLLWAVLPPVLIGAFEHVVTGTKHFGSFMQYRVVGAMWEAFGPVEKNRMGIIDELWQLRPGRFLTSPGLWLGLLFTAACIAGAIRLRRNREPN